MFIRRFASLVFAAALVIAMPTIVTAAPEQPAPSGYDAQWCGQSAYPTIHAGDTTQLSVCFMNTGTVTWIPGAATEVVLAVCVDTPAPQFFACNTLSPYADWALNWTTPRIYATTTGVITPGNVTQFLYSVKAPAGAAPGDYYLRGELVLRATGVPSHPVGYYHVIHVIP